MEGGRWCRQPGAKPEHHRYKATRSVIKRNFFLFFSNEKLSDICSKKKFWRETIYIKENRGAAGSLAGGEEEFLTKV